MRIVGIMGDRSSVREFRRHAYSGKTGAAPGVSFVRPGRLFSFVCRDLLLSSAKPCRMKEECCPAASIPVARVPAEKTIKENGHGYLGTMPDLERERRIREDH